MMTDLARRGFVMRRSLFAVLPLVALLASVTPTRADDENPTAGGKKMTEWVTMLRESENGRLRKAAVASLGQIASDNPNNSKLVKDIVTMVGKSLRNDSSAGVRAESARAIARVAADLLKAREADVGSVVVD